MFSFVFCINVYHVLEDDIQIELIADLFSPIQGISSVAVTMYSDSFVCAAMHFSPGISTG